MSKRRSPGALRILPGGIVPAFGAAFSIGAIVIAISAYLVTNYQLSAAMDHSLSRHLARLVELGGAPTATRPLAQRIAAARAGQGISEVAYRLTDPAGHLIAGTVAALEVPQGLSSATFRDGRSRPHEGRALRVDLADGSRLILVMESEAVEEINKTIWLVFGVTFGFAVLGGLAISLGLSHAIGSRLSAIRATADAIVAGDHTRRVPVDRLGGMFAEQAKSFNNMLDRVESLMANVKQVSSDVAHDLRTPLTRLRTTLASAAMVEVDEADRVALMARAEQECDAVLALFAALLRISEVEDGHRRSHIRSVHVSAMIEEIVESMEPVFVDAGQHLTARVAAGLSTRADPDLLTQLIVNLLENAHHHTPIGTRVSVEAIPGPGTVTLIVRDDGPGVPEPDRDRVVRRFVRLERSRNAPGNGLGLALARAIVVLHDGRLDLEDAQPGLIVRVTLPVVSARTDRVIPTAPAAGTWRDTSKYPISRRTAAQRRTRY